MAMAPKPTLFRTLYPLPSTLSPLHDFLAVSGYRTIEGGQAPSPKPIPESIPQGDVVPSIKAHSHRKMEGD